MKRRGVALCLALLMAAALSGCTAVRESNLMEQESNLMKNVQASVLPAAVVGPEDAAVLADFAVTLFQESMGEGNTLVSPLSVLCALGMTANGAKGKTLEQMESVLGLPVSSLNPGLHAYMAALPASEKYKLSLADAIWLKDDGSFSVEPGFLQANANYYGAGVYKAPFDASTLREINAWVSEHTDGMIKDILDRIDDDAMMYLVNALAFDAEWENKYEGTQISDGVFTAENGKTRDVEMMHSSEYRYLQGENAVGFLKYYADQKYAFAALLPDEGLSVREYTSSLTGGRLMDILANAEETTVFATLPKFESEYHTELSEALKRMGMTDAFLPGLADFSGIGKPESGDLYIGRVLHKTYIAVDEEGTKAGAATIVEARSGSTAIQENDIPTVVLDRPFLYFIIDCETNLPVFMGALMDTETAG